MVGSAGALPFPADLSRRLEEHPRRWLVTGSAGFIGSHLIESLLVAGQEVVGLDNFATGSRRNLDDVERAVGQDAWRRHRFVEADITDLATCRTACAGVHIVLHQAALGSVPRSIADPLATHAANTTGFLNLLIAARDAGVARVVYASSSAVYGDHPALPKVEDRIGAPLSPYAVSKCADELYAGAFDRCFGARTIGLRYFNLFGPRQDPAGAYAAVIPRWAQAMLHNKPVTIYGDGKTTRDFCFVANVVQANVRAAIVESPEAVGQVYNIAVGGRISLLELHDTLRDLLVRRQPGLTVPPPVYEPARPGDVRHSQADIGRARRLLGYVPTHDVSAGLDLALAWYEANIADESTSTSFPAAPP